MKSQTRAWLVCIVLFVLWGTLAAAPFQYFSDLIRELGGLLVETPVLPAAWKTFLVYLLFAVVLVVLLILGRSRSRIYLAGLCALATIIHHLVLCIRTGKVYPVSLAIAIGLALALLFLLIKSKRPGLWLSDAYTLSLAIWLIYDGPIYALSRIPGLNVGRLSPFIPVPADPLSKNLDNFLGIPLIAWAVLPLLLGVLPIIFLARGRQKG
ncbi:MAG: hypothetical protein GX218_08595 [Clostridiaceae bacterium]|nr:hypothetical protein [Clostridiaceae bacterium]